MERHADFSPRYRSILVCFWIILIAVAMYGFFFHRQAVQLELRDVMSGSLLVAGGIYLVLTILRGLIFLPSSPLVLLGIAFFPPWPLFLLTLLGILISTVPIYWFPKVLHLDNLFGSHHGKVIGRLTDLLGRQELPVITVWSFLPFTPTDIIVYVCGNLKIDFKKVLLGVALGSGSYSALCIFLGDHILRLSGLKV